MDRNSESMRKRRETGLELGGKRKRLERRGGTEDRRNSLVSWYRSLFEDVHFAVLIIDPVDGRIVDANAQASTFYGYGRKDMRRLKITDINTAPWEAIRSSFKTALAGQERGFFFRHRLSSGQIKEVSTILGPVRSPRGLYLYSLIQESPTLELQAQSDDEERNILLRELDHRVRNNLQVIEGLISLSGPSLRGNPQGLSRLRDRIRVMSLVYEGAAGGGASAPVSMERLFFALLMDIRSRHQNFRVDLRSHIGEGLTLRLDQALPLCLITDSVLESALLRGKELHRSFLLSLRKILGEGLELRIEDVLDEGFVFDELEKVIVTVAAEQLGAKLDVRAELCPFIMGFKDRAPG